MNNSMNNCDAHIIYRPLLLSSEFTTQFYARIQASSIIRKDSFRESFVIIRLLANCASSDFDETIKADLEIVNKNKPNKKIKLMNLEFMRDDDPSLAKLVSPDIFFDPSPPYDTHCDYPKTVFIDRRRLASLRGKNAESILFSFQLTLKKVVEMKNKMHI